MGSGTRAPSRTIVGGSSIKTPRGGCRHVGRLPVIQAEIQRLVAIGLAAPRALLHGSVSELHISEGDLDAARRVDADHALGVTVGIRDRIYLLAVDGEVDRTAVVAGLERVWRRAGLDRVRTRPVDDGVLLSG